MKKTGTEQYIPKIKNGFIKTMQEKYNTPKEKAEEIIESFLKVIEDASSYLFSLNHSLPYSYIGYICGWLRYYYPLEFLTVILNVNEDNQDKTAKILDYIKDYTNIKVKPARFRYSKEKYMMDKESNSIYKGISSIKFCNKTIAEELYNLRNNQYGNFVELLYDIAKNTSINMRQLDILIKLDFFSEFGNARLLNGMVEYFDMFKQGKAKQISVDKISNNEVLNNIVKRHSRLSPSGKTYMELNVISILEEIEEWMKCNDVADYTIVQKIKFHEEYLGYIGITTERKEDRKKLIILSIRPLISQYRDGEAWAYAVETMSIGSGKKSKLTIWAKTFDRIPLNIYDVVYADKVDKNNKGYWYLLNYHKIKI